MTELAKPSDFPPAEKMPWATAVKAFVLNKEGKILVLKRSADRPHSPGQYDLPGGRLGNGEDPFLGLGRELEEETGLSVKIGPVLSVNSFTRDDSQKITMLVFLCVVEGSREVSLQEKEAVSFEWLPVESAEPKLSKFIGVVENYLKYFEGKFPG